MESCARCAYSCTGLVPLLTTMIHMNGTRGRTYLSDDEEHLWNIRHSRDVSRHFCIFLCIYSRRVLRLPCSEAPLHMAGKRSISHMTTSLTCIHTYRDTLGERRSWKKVRNMMRGWQSQHAHICDESIVRPCTCGSGERCLAEKYRTMTCRC